MTSSSFVPLGVRQIIQYQWLKVKLLLEVLLFLLWRGARMRECLYQWTRNPQIHSSETTCLTFDGFETVNLYFVKHDLVAKVANHAESVEFPSRFQNK